MDLEERKDEYHDAILEIIETGTRPDLLVEAIKVHPTNVFDGSIQIDQQRPWCGESLYSALCRRKRKIFHHGFLEQ